MRKEISESDILKNGVEKVLNNELKFSIDVNSYRPMEMLKILKSISAKINQNTLTPVSNSMMIEFRNETRNNKPWKYYGLLWGRIELNSKIGPYTHVHIMPYTVDVNKDSSGITNCIEAGYKRNDYNISVLKEKAIPREREKDNFPDLDSDTGNIHHWNANTIQFVLATNNVCDLPRECMNCSGCKNESICKNFYKTSTGYGPGIKKDEKENECISINKFCYSKSTNYNLVESKFIGKDAETLNKKDSAEVLVGLLNDFINEKSGLFESKEDE
ncbi:MAG: hypothetical protein ACI4WM_06835 [Erysipelotrichaceae bacterium]